MSRAADHSTSGWAYWSYDLGGWSPVDGDRNETPQTDILVRAYPQRVAGDPRYVDFDPESRIFQLVFAEKPEVSGPTEIYLPQRRFYPEGFDLEGQCIRGSAQGVVGVGQIAEARSHLQVVAWEEASLQPECELVGT